MEAILRLKEFRFKNPDENWLDDSTDLHSIFNFLEKTNWISRLKYFYRFKDDEIRAFQNYSTLINAITQHKYDTYVLQESNSESNALGMYLAINEYGFSIILFENFNQSELIKPIVQSMIDLAINLYLHFQDRFLFGYRVGVELYQIKGYKVNRDILNGFWECNKIVDFLSHTYHKMSKIGKLNDYKTFSEFDFPSSIKKVMRQDLLVINWNDEMNSEEEISRSMNYREEWIHNNLEK